MSTDFHPDLAGKARWLPRGLGRRWMLPFLRPILRRTALSQGEGWEQVPLDGCSLYVSRPGDTVPGDGRPALLWIHGGGLIMGHALIEAHMLSGWRDRFGLTIATAEHRLAPEHPFPTPLEDCVQAWRWLASQPDVDPARIAVGGLSAGGGLAAALCQRLRDEEDVPKPVFQLLTYPMLDDRSATGSGPADRGFRVWDRRSNALGWDSYLQGHDRAAPPTYSVPARTEDLSGLPPAWIGVGTLDLFHDEDLAYAERLRDADKQVQTEVVEGAYHGFDAMDAGAPVVKAFDEARTAALGKGLGLL